MCIRDRLADILKVQADDIPERVQTLTQRLREMEKNLQAIRGQQLQAQAGQLAGSAELVGGVRLLAHDVGDGVSANDVRTLATDLRGRLGDADPSVVVLTGEADGRVSLVVATNAPAREQGFKAGALLKDAAAAMGGRGGGKEDLAQGGGGEPGRQTEALAAVRTAIQDR